MTPNTFEAIIVQGLYGGDDGRPEWRVGAGYFDQIKERNSDDFVSMSGMRARRSASSAASIWPAPTTRTATSRSARSTTTATTSSTSSTPRENTTYRLSETTKLQFALQYTDQASIGDELLRGERFLRRPMGRQGRVSAPAARCSRLAYTSAGGDTQHAEPVERLSRATPACRSRTSTATARMPGCCAPATTSSRVKGLSVYGLYVDGSTPTTRPSSPRTSTTSTCSGRRPKASLKGLMVRAALCAT